MLNRMSTIEMIENLKSKIWPKIGWYDGSDDRRRNVSLSHINNYFGVPYKLKGKFSSGREGALASKFNYDFK